MAIYDLKGKLSRPGQNPDILALAEQVDTIRNRLINLHSSVQAFDDQVHIRIGEAQISLYADGSISLHGSNVTVVADDGEVEIKATGPVRLKGSKILQK